MANLHYQLSSKHQILLLNPHRCSTIVFFRHLPPYFFTLFRRAKARVRGIRRSFFSDIWLALSDHLQVCVCSIERYKKLSLFCIFVSISSWRGGWKEGVLYTFYGHKKLNKASRTMGCTIVKFTYCEKQKIHSSWGFHFAFSSITKLKRLNLVSCNKRNIWNGKSIFRRKSERH